MKIKNKDVVGFTHIIIYIIFFSPQIVNKIPVLGDFFSYSRLLIMLYAVLFVFIKKRANLILIISITIFALVIFSTALHGDNVYSVIVRYYSMVGVLFFVELNRNNLTRELKLIFISSEIMVVINVITMLSFPNGIYIGENQALYWVIGQKQDFGIVFIVAFVSGLILWDDKRLKRHIIITYLSMTVSIIISPPLGLVICLLIITTMVWLSKYKIVYIKGKILMAMNFVGELFVLAITRGYKNMFQLQSFLANIDFGLAVNKSDTILSRVSMWLDSLDIIYNSPFIGIGCISKERYYSVTHYSLYHPIMHNQLLDFGVTGGLIAIILFISMNIIAFNNLRDIITFTLFAINILMLTECMYWPFTFFFYLLSFYVNRIDETMYSKQNKIYSSVFTK